MRSTSSYFQSNSKPQFDGPGRPPKPQFNKKPAMSNNTQMYKSIVPHQARSCDVVSNQYKISLQGMHVFQYQLEIQGMEIWDANLV